MSIETLMIFTLMLVRVACIFTFLPFLGSGNIPRAIKAVASVAVVVALMGSGLTVPYVALSRPAQFLAYVLAEGLFGIMIGLSAQLVFKSLRNAGEMVGQQMGMALAVVADPLSGDQTTLVGSFCETIGVLVFFAVNGHLAMLSAVHRSFTTWPMGTFLSAEFIKRVGVKAVAHSFVMALQLAAPLLLLTFLVSVTMAIMARVIPEINVLIVGFPVRIGVGLIGLTLFVPVLVHYGGEVARTMVTFTRAVAVGS